MRQSMQQNEKQTNVRKKDILQKLTSPVSAKNKYYWLLKHLMHS
jgi:hypothetical protein